MFYENQPQENQERYKRLLAAVGSLSNLFSASDKPMLYYRGHENIFCKAFEAENLSREDCSADAKKDKIGIGLKTWVDQNDQKVAEFGKLKKEYADLTGIELVKRIAEYRNLRISTTMNLHDIKQMIYHVIRRIPNAMEICETAFDKIDIDNIVIDESRGNANNTYFSDGHHTYHFSTSKNTLYMLFDDMETLDTFDVNILDDPYTVLETLLFGQSYISAIDSKPEVKKEQVCLRLYSTKRNGEKFVADKSGLNQWNGVRTSNRTRKDGTVVHVEKQRDENELYIPYPAEDRRRNRPFFPARDVPFKLRLPDGQVLSAKICQSDDKAIMSNPNNALGEWLLRKVLELPVGKQVTYKMLQEFDIDSVIFTKEAEGEYSIDFCHCGTYENFYGLPDADELEQSE